MSDEAPFPRLVAESTDLPAPFLMLGPMAGEDLGSRLAAIRRGIAAACERAGRDPDQVTVVAAAKTVEPDEVRRAVDLGVSAIGHNYVQELRAARAALGEDAVEWHYIGTLRSGTAHVVADHADVVETVAGDRAARRLAGRAARSGRTLDVLLEVDLTGERSGLAPADVAPAADSVAALDGLRVRGLMTIAPLGSLDVARTAFRRLRDLRDEVRDQHPDVLELSMGMSLDYEVAVEEGATMVRIGSGLFGPRPT